MDEIASVPGIDVLFVGPYDLGNNIGHPILDGTMHEDLKQAIAKIQKAAKDHDKSTGMFCTSGEQARTFADQGFNMVSLELDSAITALIMPIGKCNSGYDGIASLSYICTLSSEGILRSYCS